MAVNEDRAVPPCFSNNFQVTNLNEGATSNILDVNSWNNALDSALEKKTENFNEFATPSPVHKIEGTNEDGITPSPQSRAEYSAEDAEDEFSNADDLPG